MLTLLQDVALESLEFNSLSNLAGLSFCCVNVSIDRLVCLALRVTREGVGLFLGARAAEANGIERFGGGPCCCP